MAHPLPPTAAIWWAGGKTQRPESLRVDDAPPLSNWGKANMIRPNLKDDQCLVPQRRFTDVCVLLPAQLRSKSAQKWLLPMKLVGLYYYYLSFWKSSNDFSCFMVWKWISHFSYVLELNVVVWTVPSHYCWCPNRVNVFNVLFEGSHNVHPLTTPFSVHPIIRSKHDHDGLCLLNSQGTVQPSYLLTAWMFLPPSVESWQIQIVLQATPNWIWWSSDVEQPERC